MAMLLAVTPFDFFIASQTTQSAHVAVTLGNGKVVGAVDVGAGARAELQTWVRPGWMEVRSSVCRGTVAIPGHASSFRVLFSVGAQGRCDIRIYPQSS